MLLKQKVCFFGDSAERNQLIKILIYFHLPDSQQFEQGNTQKFIFLNYFCSYMSSIIIKYLENMLNTHKTTFLSFINELKNDQNRENETKCGFETTERDLTDPAEHDH